MELMRIKTQTDPSGCLRVDLPTNIKESDVEVVIVISPVEKNITDQKYDFSDLAGKSERKEALAVQADLQTRGISQAEAGELRSAFMTFAEDWDSPEMSIYDNYDAFKSKIQTG